MRTQRSCSGIPRLCSSLALSCIGPHIARGPLAGDSVGKKSPGKCLGCFASFFFFFSPDCPVLGHEGLIAPIGVLSASGSEECLSKLLFSFLVFGKRKEAWRWSQAVTKWGLTPGKESWKY